MIERPVAMWEWGDRFLGEIHRAGLGMVAISTAAPALLFVRDQNCLRKICFFKRTQVQSEDIWGCAPGDMGRWPGPEDGKLGS